MATDTWLTSILLSVLFSAPWIAATIWVRLRSPRGPEGEFPSMAEVTRRHLWVP